jgi:hypothetical protein
MKKEIGSSKEEWRNRRETGDETPYESERFK